MNFFRIWIFQSNKEAVLEGLTVEIPGRFQKFNKNLFYDGAHNPIGIRKSINALINLLSEENKGKIMIVCGFTREKNLKENVNNILTHKQTDRIESIILVESEPGEPEMINYQPN